LPSDALERKLTAIMYADVVGFSRLTGEDEEGTYRVLRERLARISELVSAQGGRGVKFIGDAVFAEFASVVAAVTCGTEIQAYLAETNRDLPEDRQIIFRIGINLGEVIIDGDDLFGDGVNVAARLERLSDPGGICISASVHKQVEGRIDCAFEDMGEQEVKNIVQPVRVYRVLMGTSAPAIGARKKTRSRKSRKTLAGAVMGAILLMLAAGGWYLIGPQFGSIQRDAAEVSRPSLAVLPFQNISGDK